MATELHAKAALVSEGIRVAVQALWVAGIAEIFIDGSFWTEKPEVADVDRSRSGILHSSCHAAEPECGLPDFLQAGSERPATRDHSGD